MKISSVSIKNIRGFSDYYREFAMIPNKASLLVAPNGSGKSSFAIAFKSLIGKRSLQLVNEDIYNRDSNNAPEIVISVIEDDGSITRLCANSDKNDISQRFSVAVINNRIKPTIIRKKVQGHDVSTSRNTIDPIVLEGHIPSNCDVQYNFEEINNIHLKRGVIPNIRSLLQSNDFFCEFPNDKLRNRKRVIGKIERVMGVLRQYENTNKSVAEIKQDLHGVILPELQAVAQLQEIVGVVKKIENNDDELSVQLKSMQLLMAFNHNNDDFHKKKIRAEYEKRKANYIKLFKSLKKTWQDIKPKESGERLIVEIPYAERLSNGERDIIVFLAMLENAKLTLNKNDNILIIDEVFDYLDDANLIAAQYYITSLIAEMKKEGKKIFPIILTHLNPDFYNQYAFKDLKVYYLEPLPNPHKSELMMALLTKRGDLMSSGAEDNISKYMLHYYIDYSHDMTDFLNASQLSAGWNNINKFKQYCKNNMTDYIAGKTFCPLAVCVMLRELIEQHCYDMLHNNDEREKFIEINGTNKKLHYAEENGCDVPELFFLLGLIYNDPLHNTDKKDLRQTLYSRLQNNTIRAMISRVNEMCAKTP